MPTPEKIAMLDLQIKEIQSGRMRGDFMQRPGQKGLSQAEQRLIKNLSLQKLTPEQRAEVQKREAAAAQEMNKMRALIGVFKSTNVDTLTKAKTNDSIEKIRALSLDDSNPDQWLNFYRQLNHPMYPIRGQVLGKFRFNWGPDGKPVYVAWTRQSWENFFRHKQRGRWIPNIPALYQCPPEWETNWIEKYFRESEAQRLRFRPNDKRHVWQYTSGSALCKKPKKSTWVKIRKGVVGAVAIVAAVYLGPAALAMVQNGASAMTGGLIPAAGGGAGAGAGAGAAGAATAGGGSSAVAAATTGQKLLTGAKTLVGYVNKARTIQAIAKGELPPVPIGIGGASFTDWAMIVAKQKIKEEAVDYAMEKGVEYVERKMTEKEESKLRAEIEALQREINKITPPEVKKMPPEPDPELAKPVLVLQKKEEKKQADFEKFIVPGAIVAGALLLGG